MVERTVNYTLPYVAEPLVFHEDELTSSTLPGKLITIFTVADMAFIFVILLTIAIIKDVKINYERHPIFLPFRPPHGFRMYAVLLETGQSPAGGTSAKVFLRIIGKLTKTPGFTLICTSKQRYYGSRRLFGSQNKDIFIISVPHYLGGIESFEVMTDRRGDSPPWLLKSIRVMSLNNKKCWKSEVSTWLRGDKNPYSIKASLIGALSTREYFLKVFLQHHLWTSAWCRSLGSSLQSFHRSLLLWISIGCSIWVTHFFLYDAKLLLNIRFNRINTPLYTTNDVAGAACISSAAGVLVATILRLVMVSLTGGTKWDRLDDKDDLCHLMGPDTLEYVQGSVVRRTTHFVPSKIITTGDLQNLTEDQRLAIKHITECKVSDCSLKRILNNPTCASYKDCAFNQNEEIFVQASENTPVQVEKPIIPRYSVPMNKQPEDNRSCRDCYQKRECCKSATIETSDSSQSPCNWDPSAGKPEDFYKIMPLLCDPTSCESDPFHKSQGVSGSREKCHKIQKKKEKKQPGLLENIFNKNSANLNNVSTHPFTEKKIKKNKSAVPGISARSGESELSFYTVSGSVTESDISKSGKLVVELAGQQNDSLSEPESDQEIVTKSARTDSEINLVRRPAYIYDAAPQWHDKYHVWTENLNGGPDHHLRVNKRYDFSAATVVPAGNAPLNKMERSIYHYLLEEESIPPGRLVLPTIIFATLLVCVLSLGAGAIAGFAVYQRFFVSDADTVIFLYAILFSVLLNLLLMSTLAAIVFAMIATCARRRRILQRRDRNAKYFRY